MNRQLKSNSIVTLLFSVLCLALTSNASAVVFDITIAGSDSIWLAGRTDLTIPPASDPWPGGMLRHGGPTPEEIQETLPPGVSVAAGDIVRVLDPAIGAISFFNGFGGTVYGPSGNGLPNSSVISSFGGISGYIGTQGALVGLFLNDDIPDGSVLAPPRINFSTTGTNPLGIDFPSLTPELAQVFYIGDGATSGGDFQTFIAPSGATRLFVGITDAFGFNGAPGAFDDNDGSYRIRLGINTIPTLVDVPEPGSLGLIGLGLVALARRRNNRR